MKNTLIKTPSESAFELILERYGLLVRREFWEGFWHYPKKGKCELKKRPESISKGYLGLFLHGSYGNTRFSSINQELMTEDRYVDLLVECLGEKYLIELKVITSFKEGYNGIDQLNAYMPSYGLTKSYLVIHDARKTNKGEQFKQSYTRSNGEIYVIVIKIYHKDKI